MPRYLVKHCFWVCLWRCSQKRLAFESVDLSRADCLLPKWVGIIQPTEGQNRAKWFRKSKFCMLGLRHQSSPDLGLGLTPSRSLVPMPLDSCWDSHHQLPGSPVCRLQMVGFLSLRNHMRLFLIIISFNYLFWRMLTNTVSFCSTSVLITFYI